MLDDTICFFISCNFQTEYKNILSKLLLIRFYLFYPFGHYHDKILFLSSSDRSYNCNLWKARVKEAVRYKWTTGHCKTCNMYG